MSTFSFDATNVEPDAGRGGVIPKNWYTAVITASDIKPSANDPDAQRMNLSFKIHEGDFKGAMVFHGLNIKNSSEKAMAISYAQLSSIMHAIDYLKIKQDTSELHNKPLRIRVKVVPPEFEEDGVTVKYEEKNEITAFKSTKDPSAVSVDTAAKPKPAAASVAPPPVNGGAWQPQTAPATVATPAQVAQPAPAATPPAWQAPPTAQPWADASGQQAQPVAAAVAAPSVDPLAAAQAALALAQAQANLAAAQAAAVAQPAEQTAPAVATPQAQPGQVVPPWMQGQAAQ